MHAKNTHTIYAVKIVNKRPRNLLNEIQNVFINGKQIKTTKITQIIPWFYQFYAKTTTGSSMPTCIRQQWPLHGDMAVSLRVCNTCSRSSQAATN